jgi:hypothetical protein
MAAIYTFTLWRAIRRLSEIEGLSRVRVRDSVFYVEQRSDNNNVLLP